MTWFWRLLLFAYGADFRRRHGAEILAAIAIERAQPRYRGALGAVRHTVRNAAAMVRASTGMGRTQRS